MNKGAVIFCMLMGAWTGPIRAEGPAPLASPGYPGNRLDLRHGRQIYQSACAQCHRQGKSGAPRLGDPDAWKQRSYDAFSVMSEHEQNGFLGMPAQGGNPNLAQPDIADAVFYMTQKLQRSAHKAKP